MLGGEKGHLHDEEGRALDLILIFLFLFPGHAPVASELASQLFVLVFFLL